MKCDTPFEKHSDYVLLNEIFKTGKWGVTDVVVCHFNSRLGCQSIFETHL